MAEGTPANPTCDGVTTACQWNHASAQTTPTSGQLGELTVKLDNTFPEGGATSYTELSDSAPDFYVEEQGTSGPPSQTDPNVARRSAASPAPPRTTTHFTGTTKTLATDIVDQAGTNASRT